MKELFQKRLSKNLQQNIKYLTLVFNDFFVLALIFLLGGFLFWYAQVLQQIPSNLWFYKPLVGLALFIPLLSGKLASLLEQADAQFIWTKDVDILGYLKKARNYSMLVPTILTLLVAGIIFPFATVKAGVNLVAFGLVVVGLLIWKYAELTSTIRSFYRFENPTNAIWLIHLAEIVALIVSLYIPGVAVVVSFAVAVYLNNFEPQLFDWRGAIDFEQKRQEVVLGFYSLFTDVKNRPIKIKRRKYLDVFLSKNLSNQSADFYLYQRSMLRNPESLNLMVRMTVFAILIAVLVQAPMWVFGLDALVIFLTIYQLLPVFHTYEKNLMYQIMPVKTTERVQAFKKIMTFALVGQTIVVILGWLLFLPNKLELLMYAVGLAAWTLLLIYVYLPSKLKNIDQKVNRTRTNVRTTNRKK